ncbi:hypothetical protein OHB36_36720 [Streptomyces sp. NBC_00320]|uniref:hypothetical protein n=1 Tax=Streptomyces sp. NBC_00320 TaxID=2975711 RepID=UPI00225B77B9|nr:hypothetical protein [Streptomyces sp. NBC_00320]MCX5152208.1 hypothetical protein [Streptomyces sp. NBC_00320]
MLTNRLLRTAAPIAMAALALTACGPEDNGPAASESQEASGSDLRLTEGKSVTTCEIYLVPENVQPVFVGFQGDRDYRNPSLETGTAPEVVWKVG